MCGCWIHADKDCFGAYYDTLAIATENHMHCYSTLVSGVDRPAQVDQQILLQVLPSASGTNVAGKGYNIVLDAVLPILLSAINRFLEFGVVPASLKAAVVTPMLKKEGLDPEILSNYRPVSNLSFVSKLTERVVTDQLTVHLEVNGLQDPMSEY